MINPFGFEKTDMSDTYVEMIEKVTVEKEKLTQEIATLKGEINALLKVVKILSEKRYE